MTRDHYLWLLAMLEAGTDHQKQMATYRLSRPDVETYDRPDDWDPAGLLASKRPNGAVPKPVRPEVRRSIAVTRIGFRRCWFSDHRGCGCSGTYCGLLRRNVTLNDCLSCPWMARVGTTADATAASP